MGDGDIDFSIPEVFSGPNELSSSCSMDSFFDEILKDRQDTHACTHTHTCNPPGPDLSHTHTCLHVHTKIVSASADETAESTDKESSKKRPCGNREAVRKYREKKKARAASLEEEVAQLRAVNQQLMKRLQGQAVLEAEVARLRCLLVDIRGRIEGEIGCFPYQKPTNLIVQGNFVGGGGQVLNSCEGLRCDDQLYCRQPGTQANEVGEVACQNRNVQCMGSSTTGSENFLVCRSGNGMAAGCSANADKTIGTHASTEG